MANQEGKCRASSAYGKAPTNQLCPQQTWKSGRQASDAKTEKRKSKERPSAKSLLFVCELTVNGPNRLTYLSVWFLEGGMVWEGYRGVALSEKV